MNIWSEIAMCSVGVVVAGFGVAYWLDQLTRARQKRIILIKDGKPTEDLLSTMRETGAAYGSQILPILGPPLFDRRARRLADLIILKAPPAIIAVDLWLTLVAYCGGWRRRALWYGVVETWRHHVMLPLTVRRYKLWNLCIVCGHNRKRHFQNQNFPACRAAKCKCLEFEGAHP